MLAALHIEGAKMMNFVLKTRKCVSKTRKSVSKTRKSVFLNDEFVRESESQRDGMYNRDHGKNVDLSLKILGFCLDFDLNCLGLNCLDLNCLDFADWGHILRHGCE